MDGRVRVLADLLGERLRYEAGTIGDGYTACGFGAEINDSPRYLLVVSHIWLK